MDRRASRMRGYVSECTRFASKHEQETSRQDSDDPRGQGAEDKRGFAEVGFNTMPSVQEYRSILLCLPGGVEGALLGSVSVVTCSPGWRWCADDLRMIDTISPILLLLSNSAMMIGGRSVISVTSPLMGS